MTYAIEKLARDDGTSIALYTWPAPSQPIKAAVQITHGLVEHACRYDRFAQALTSAGYVVYASDHRGHGQTLTTPTELGHFSDHDGFGRIVEDLHAVNQRIASARPGVPRILFAHSFGSFAAQAYLAKHGESLAAAVLSGTNSGVALLVKAAVRLARLERWRLGPRGRSPLLTQLSFGAYNNAFKPVRTEYDWLSRDPVEVDKYIADPLCGGELTTESWVELLGALGRLEERTLRASIPKHLPIYLIEGALDPVGRAGRGPRALADAYTRAGLADVTLKLYPNARHEMLNETNRDDVTSDVIGWLDTRFVRAGVRSRGQEHV